MIETYDKALLRDRECKGGSGQSKAGMATAPAKLNLVFSGCVLWD